MTKRIFGIFASLIMVLSMFCGLCKGFTNQVHAENTVLDDLNQTDKLLDMINNLRASNQQKNLVRNKILDSYAATRANENADIDIPSHYRKGNQFFSSIFKENKTSVRFSNEFIMAGKDDADSFSKVYDQWLKNDITKKEMLNKNYINAGIAVIKKQEGNDTKYVWVMLVSDTICEYKPLLGDANGDNKITAEDATLVLIDFATAIAYGPTYETKLDMETADYNKDGKITAEDATGILIRFAEILTE